MEIKDKKDIQNLVANHLSRLHIPGSGDTSDLFLDEHLLAISSHAPSFAHILAVDYVSKYVESIPTKTNNYQEVLIFITRYLFS